MFNATKYHLVLIFGFLCLIGFAAQTVQLWRVNEQLAELSPKTQEIPASIEQRLLAELDKKPPMASNPGAAIGSPFANLNQIQNYMDSVFGGFSPYSFGSRSLFPQSGLNFSSALPKITLTETDEYYQIVIPVTADQEIELNTALEDNALSVTGVISEKAQHSQFNFAGSFVSQRQFAKTLELPSPIDEFGMTTEQTVDGIEITLPKKIG